MIDTGFNLFLTLPSLLITALGLSFAVPAKATLADGTVVSLDCYWLTLLWEGQPRRIVVAAEDRPLIGMSLLYGSRVTLDVVNGGPVTIEPLP